MYQKLTIQGAILKNLENLSLKKMEGNKSHFSAKIEWSEGQDGDFKELHEAIKTGNAKKNEYVNKESDDEEEVCINSMTKWSSSTSICPSFVLLRPSICLCPPEN